MLLLLDDMSQHLKGILVVIYMIRVNIDVVVPHCLTNVNSRSIHRVTEITGKWEFGDSLIFTNF